MVDYYKKYLKYKAKYLELQKQLGGDPPKKKIDSYDENCTKSNTYENCSVKKGNTQGNCIASTRAGKKVCGYYRKCDDKCAVRESFKNDGICEKIKNECTFIPNK
jgi:hypothetical protein